MPNHTKRGTFPPGRSGNSAGRPQNSGEAAALRKIVGERMPAVIEQIVLRAMGGDMAAARLLVERCWPSMKPIEAAAPFDLPTGTLTAKADAVVSAIAAGTLAPQQGAQIVGALVGVARVVDTDEILRRIEKMEAYFAENQHTP